LVHFVEEWEWPDACFGWISAGKETQVPFGYETLLVPKLVNIPAFVSDSGTGGPHRQFRECREQKNLCPCQE